MTNEVRKESSRDISELRTISTLITVLRETGFVMANIWVKVGRFSFAEKVVLRMKAEQDFLTVVM